MKKSKWILRSSILMAALTVLAGCREHDDDEWKEVEVPTTAATFTFSLPQRIISTPKETTRMQPDVVQYEETAATFRGLDDIHLFFFNTAPGANTQRLGRTVKLPTLSLDLLEGLEQTNHTVYKDVDVPLGTTYFGFYGRAVDAAPGSPATSHDDRRHYGVLTAKGLGNHENNSNADISFSPVQICTSTDKMGGSMAGYSLLALLNDLLNITGPEPAPENHWGTATHEAMREAYRGLTALRTSSTFNVEATLGTVYSILSKVPASAPGGQLAQLLMQKIESVCTGTPDTQKEELHLISNYQGYPADLNLPSGAARIVWNDSQQRFEFPDFQEYGKGLDIPSLNDYVYPPSLYYHVFSPVVASDSLQNLDSLNVSTWAQVIDSVYADAPREVSGSTQSVAMVEQVQYAVGRLDTRVILDGTVFYDAYGRQVDVSKGYTLKGIIVGGQRAVDYNFKPKAGAKEYTLYDSDLRSGNQHVTRTLWTDYNHTLGLETDPNSDVLLALELVNDGDTFQGADGRIVHGATFYLVANLAPRSAENYNTNLNQIFRKDYVTTANLSIVPGNRDINNDSIPDTDNNYDGIPDVYVMGSNGYPVGVDMNGDGVADPYDYNHDGKKDAIVTEDLNGDGTIDIVGWDLNGNGHVDVEIKPDSEGIYPATPTVGQGLSTATYGIPNMEWDDTPPAIGLSVNLLWNKGIVFPEVPL